MQVSDIVRTEGQIAATKAATDKMASASDADREKAKADWEKAHPGKTATADDINGQVYQNFYNDAFAQTGLGTGGAVQQAIQAATAAIQGLAGGNIGQAISGAAAPYLAEQIHKLAPNEESRAMAHAVVGAVTSWAAGNSAAAGAAGAVTGELMAQLVMNQLYPGKEVSELTETQKQTISALGTLAAGLAGGITGDSTADVVAGAQAGKNSAENNHLLTVAARGCAAMSPCRNKVAEQLLEIGAKAGIAGLAGAGGAALKEVADKMTAEELDHLATLSLMGNDELTSKYLSALQDKYAPSHTGGDQIVETTPTNTGGNQITDIGPTNTGNNQLPEQGVTNTGNTEGAPDTGGNTTITPVPDGPNKDDLAYLAEGRDNRLPIPEPTVASNGLKVESNTKHTPGAQGFRPSAGIEPRNSLELFESSVSIANDKARYSMSTDGSVHRYFPDNTGTYHWSGSTGDIKNPMQLDNKVKAQLRKQEGWKLK